MYVDFSGVWARTQVGLFCCYTRDDWEHGMMLHEALDAAVKERLIVCNSTNGTTVPKNNYPDKQVLDDGQLEKFLGMIEAHPDWRDFFYTECMTGLRRGEICGLKWSASTLKTAVCGWNGRFPPSQTAKYSSAKSKPGAGKRTISTLPRERNARKSTPS